MTRKELTKKYNLRKCKTRILFSDFGKSVERTLYMPNGFDKDGKRKTYVFYNNNLHEVSITWKSADETEANGILVKNR